MMVGNDSRERQIGRICNNLLELADEMENVGASTMTPHELLRFFAKEVRKQAGNLERGKGAVTNNELLFGTPEKTVETLAAIETHCDIDWDCNGCPLDGVMPSCVMCGADERFAAATLEWMRKEVSAK